MSNRTKRFNTNSTVIKRRRLSKGYTQAELGNIVGLKKSTISMIESGKSNVSARKIPIMAQALGITTDELLLSSIN